MRKYLSTAGNRTDFQFVSRLVVGSMLAGGVQFELVPLALWVNGSVDAGHLVSAALASVLTTLVGVPMGFAMRNRSWTAHGHSVLVAMALGAIFHLSLRIKLLLVNIWSGLDNPALELIHAGQSEALVHLPGEVSRWAIGGTIYWWVVFRAESKVGFFKNSPMLVLTAVFGWVMVALYLANLSYLIWMQR